jgi:hypothetical protein
MSMGWDNVWTTATNEPIVHPPDDNIWVWRATGQAVPWLRRLITGLSSARGIDVRLLCLYVVLSCVGRGLCDGLITRPEESYRVS